jgi:hypothetical protein
MENTELIIFLFLLLWQTIEYNFFLSNSIREEKRSKDTHPTFTPVVKSTSIQNTYSSILDEPIPNIQRTASGISERDSSYKSLPRNYTSASNAKSWTLLDTEMAKDKGMKIQNLEIEFIFKCLIIK